MGVLLSKEAAELTGEYQLPPQAQLLLSLMATYCCDPDDNAYPENDERWGRCGTINGKMVPAQRVTLSRDKLIELMWGQTQEKSKREYRTRRITRLIRMLIDNKLVSVSTRAGRGQGAAYDLHIHERAQEIKIRRGAEESLREAPGMRFREFD